MAGCTILIVDPDYFTYTVYMLFCKISAKVLNLIPVACSDE